MTDHTPADRPPIRIRGARQHNLRNLDLDIETGQLVVVTGVSGSGKSSLVFDTLYAEGQRRYVETFSAYARQFLDRMDRPQVDRIEGVPPAIAIDQSNPVRTSRSTVGTMTELNDHLKLLFARAATLHCRQCARPVQRDHTHAIADSIRVRAAAIREPADPRLILTFDVGVPAAFSEEEIESFLNAQGFTRIHGRRTAPDGRSTILEVVADRFRAAGVEPERLAEGVEQALRHGQGRMAVHALRTDGTPHAVWNYSDTFSCADCGIDYSAPVPAQFSFNSALGACETCRGFGRVMGIDLDLVIPDARLSLAGGAIRPWQSGTFASCQEDLKKFGKRAGVDLDRPWKDLPSESRHWVIEGSPDWSGSWSKEWYGVRRFFQDLESRAYKMHIRVLLSRYRSYTPCTECQGARIKPEGLLWRLGAAPYRPAAAAPRQSVSGHQPSGWKPFKPTGASWDEATLSTLPGLSLHDLMLLPLEALRDWFSDCALPGREGGAFEVVLSEIRARLTFLVHVGLGYLTLDRQSRTLSGGEVQRINLTTALGTSLVNTLFVLDEPSIGLHPRDMNRIIEVMHRLRDAGNTLVVVEHDPLVMFAADRIIDIGPGPGERGGRIVFDGPASALAQAPTLTGDYLSQRRQVSRSRARSIPENQPRLLLQGARANNLRNLDIAFPLGLLVCLSGVSGSGKSTLMQDVLLPALLRAFGQPSEAPGEHDALLGTEWIDDVVHIDQSPIGKTTRSTPASHVGAFDAIRKRFAATPAAQERQFTAGTFSFNAGTGRCPTCSGNGFEHVEMQFLSDVYLRCAECNGSRYRASTLEVTVTGFLPARPEPDAPTTPDTPTAPGSPSTPLVAHTLHIAQVLELTVAEALAFFGDEPEIGRRLQPLSDVGLDYLRLGQPVPTLSGGEAQRLKLAGHLAEAADRSRRRTRGKRCGTLFLFDEPSTGLHFDDVARLIDALRRLQDAGHSLLVIEHNLDILRACDWIIDLGPEGGQRGGQLVAEGPPERLEREATSATGEALAAYSAQLDNAQHAARRPAATYAVSPASADFATATLTAATLTAADSGVGSPLQSAWRARGRHAIVIHHAREHNLKNVNVEIPHGGLTVVTGVSGSGKSTLAFGVVFGEGQRRYLESLNAYARQFVQPATRPDVEGVYGIPPTVAIEQRTSRGGRKSTVSTLTEVHHFLRLLYQKLGVQHCPKDGTAIEPQGVDTMIERLMARYAGETVTLLAPLVVARKGIYTDLARALHERGFTFLRVDGEFHPTSPFPKLHRYTEHTIELPVATLVVQSGAEAALRTALHTALEHGKGVVQVLHADPNGHETVSLFSTRRACSTCGTGYPEPDPRLFSYNSAHGWCPACLGAGLRVVGRIRRDELTPGMEGDTDAGITYDPTTACAVCDGQRLNPLALAVTVHDRSIAAVSQLAIHEAHAWVGSLAYGQRESAIARDLLPEIRHRLQFLIDVGLGYLTLDRAAPTLSGGEAQRIRLAGQLGSNLQGVCYVLDEPTIGLHPRDNRILLDTLVALRDRGNTLLVVEHDEDTIERADHIIDIGPGAGQRGGEIIATGDHAAIRANPNSLTGQFLNTPLRHPVHGRPRTEATDPALVVRGAGLHNLKVDHARFPLGRLTVVTGVSGSGKSTLTHDVLLDNVRALLAGERQSPTHCLGLEGWAGLQRVQEVDQTPIGKTPRSCPATYVGFWDDIRRILSDTSEARVRGYTAGRFSFNTAGGRCPSCDGQGIRTVEMSFMPDVKVRCDVCNGLRFDHDTLQVRLNGLSAGDILNLTVDDALPFFRAWDRVVHPLQLLQDVGLGYLTLGQHSPTLSGGEAQRIKLVTELARIRTLTGVVDPLREARNQYATRRLRKGAQALSAAERAPGGGALYVLDEPTVGLHMADVERLIRVMHRLVDAGNTLVVVEHHLDIWAEADWIIDLGPEGGAAGGQVVAQGTPETLSHADSHTGRALQPFLKARGQPPAAATLEPLSEAPSAPLAPATETLPSPPKARPPRRRTR